MPEFILNHRAKGRSKSNPKGYESLNEFAKGYVEAMFFTNGDTGNERREDHLNDLGVARLTLRAIADIKKDCADFEAKAEPLLARVYLDLLSGYDLAAAGRDFWFTRQGHGVGFWDREKLKVEVDGETLGNLLSKVAKSFGECTPYVQGGWIYYS